MNWTDSNTEHSRATLNTARYGVMLIAGWNRFDACWNWTATVRYIGADRAAFHQFGVAEDIGACKIAAEAAYTHWQASSDLVEYRDTEGA